MKMQTLRCRKFKAWSMRLRCSIQPWRCWKKPSNFNSKLSKSNLKGLKKSLQCTSVYQLTWLQWSYCQIYVKVRVAFPQILQSKIKMFQINKTRRIQPQLQSRRPQKWLVQRAAFSANNCKIFSEFFHTFLLAAWRIHTVISTLFGNNFLKKKRKKIIEDKRLQSLFLWVKGKKLITLPVCLQICHLGF